MCVSASCKMGNFLFYARTAIFMQKLNILSTYYFNFSNKKSTIFAILINQISLFIIIIE